MAGRVSVDTDQGLALALACLAGQEGAAPGRGRNRWAEHVGLLEDDPRYAWTVRQRGEWTPPVGRVPKAAHEEQQKRKA